MGGFANNVSFVGALLKGFKWGFAAFVVALYAHISYMKYKKKHLMVSYFSHNTQNVTELSNARLTLAYPSQVSCVALPMQRGS